VADPSLIDVPDEGGLDAVSVPRLLAQAWRDERCGILEIRHGQTEHRLLVRDGAPLNLDSNAAEDGFARFLEDTSQISASDRTNAERVARERECPEASAVLALKLLDAKSLYTAMRAHSRGRIAETFAWSAGQYRWTDAAKDESANPTGAAKPHDLLALFQTELPKRWGTERLFAELMSIQDVHGDITPRFRKVAQKLAAQAETAARVLSRLDGTLPLGRVLGECAGDPVAAATLWTLLRTGMLRITDGTARHSAPTEFEFSVEVADTPSTTTASAANAANNRGTAAAQPATPSEESPKATALREEIQALLSQLVALDHYSALGLEEDAGPAQIKKAYFKAAKKYHPDALARLGLDDLRDDAAQVFARIAEAFETLSDTDKKAAYDAGGSDEPEIDTARLAQAETSFRKGEILVKMGNFEGALEYLAPAVELWPEEPAYQAGLGWALYKQPKSDIASASEHLEIALRQAPDDAVILFRLGMVKRAAGETDLASELIARARSIEPTIDE